MHEIERLEDDIDDLAERGLEPGEVIELGAARAEEGTYCGSPSVCSILAIAATATP